MLDVNVPVLPVAVSALAALAVVWLWYMPQLFGKLWMKEAKISEEEMKKIMQKNAARGSAIELIGLLLMVFVLSVFMNKLGVKDLKDAAQLSGLIWLGFRLPVAISRVAWESGSWRVIVLEGYSFLTMLVAAWIMITWK